MAGQRFGIWPARLVRLLIPLVCLGLTAGLIAKRLASQWMGENSPSVASTGDDSTPGALPVDSHPLDAVLRIAKDAMETHKRSHRTYRATVHKRERIGKELGPESKMELKLRYRQEDPENGLRQMDVYLKFLEPKSQAGRELIWKEGFNDGLMVVHETGLLNITKIELSPTSRLAMLGNRYPVSDIGIERLLNKLLAKGHRDRHLGDCQVSLIDSVEVAGRNCKRIEVCHPQRQVTVGDKTIEHEFHKAIIDIDSELGVPIRYASYMWPEKDEDEPILDEEFLYENLEINPELGDLDFDPDNPAYNYP